ncbi:YbjQ family protein [Burkholderia pseudomultivorans]|uniref:YbjQ family protein n=1 Tax=Burkholderia pseudomultivorans TaxID=1207504 RepID=UPI002874A4E9|nr:YbjQ family protein [Burkholderia pseudomultivorans]MDS0859423.1 YbjQ family protein [Burkholderia pseudomultivorans]
MNDTSRSLDDLSPDRVTTAFDLPGHTTVRSLGVAQGIVVRSRSIVGSFGAGLQTLFGGNITLYTSLCEKARQQAFDKMLADARRLGANAVVAMRYDSTEIGTGVTEVICYGTAVRVARDSGA